MTTLSTDALVERVREAIDVDWYGPNPAYKPTVAAGREALTTLADRVKETTEQNERMALAISDALGRYQVTHIHEGLRQAMKDMP